uniref:Uncharacterized protein n=1 Tax=Meloidogyne enterolobii TaxID=390850 RepID=A0A6V7TSG6_MELEN|nr:unnamed protein product [Meloidogyne enterolobii]
MIISSFIVTHLLLFFVGMLSRDLLVEGMETGTNGGMRNQKERGGPSRPHPKKLKTGRHVLKHQSNDFSLTELSFLIRILEEVEENEVEQNVYSIQDILFAKGIGLLRAKHILNQGQLAHLIWGNRGNMSPIHFNLLMHENQMQMDSELTAHINERNSDQILHTVVEISSKIGKLITGYENKLNDAMNTLKSNLGDYVYKIGLIKWNKSRYYELKDLNELAKANQILKKYINSDHNAFQIIT